ncbi:branched-chain amino acid ABC transporter permease [Fodinicurvata halophila]|uniref:Branched-chain amino acid ABC transporter permease n=1 Tax=Fodinicurvata halophila TaxID=1419723 RepID=A0ABV8UHM6_9PROT
MASITEETSEKKTVPTLPSWLRGLRWYHPVVAVLLLIYPLLATDFWIVQIGAQSLILGTVGLSLMLLAGYGGMVSLSQLTIAGLAGYLVAIFGNAEWPAWLMLVGAVSLATLAAALIGWISARTSGIYTIMITLAISVAFYYLVLQNDPIFNSFNGFAGIDPPAVFGVDWRAPLPFFYLTLAVVALCYFFVLYLSRTPFGLALQAVRDNPRRMSSLGFNVIAHRVAAHTVAGAIAGIGGVLLVWQNGQISPGSVGIGPVIDILILTVLGGLAHPVGPFIGALIFILMENFAIDLIDRERFNTVIGAVFLVIVLFSPDGVLGLWGKLKSWLAKQSARNKADQW